MGHMNKKRVYCLTVKLFFVLSLWNITAETKLEDVQDKLLEFFQYVSNY